MASSEIYKDFYEELKKNVVMDFCTAGIKAEVIIDTLITPYVCEIVKIGLLGKDNYRQQNWPVDKLELVAKEFPIEREKDQNNLQNAKIDYLLRSGNQFYIVELKTTKGSENSKQLRRYANYLSEDSSIFNCFIDIIYKLWKNDKLINFVSDKNRQKRPTDIKSTEKYISTIVNILGSGWKDKLENKQVSDKKDLQDLLFSCENGKNIKLIYLTLYKSRENTESAINAIIGKKKDKDALDKVLRYKTEFISIHDFINNKDSSGKYNSVVKAMPNWKLVSEILKELFNQKFLDEYAAQIRYSAKEEKIPND